MYFQVSPSFNKPKVPKIVVEEEEIHTLVLAPFTQIPKLAFQDVAVNSLHKLKLNITNNKPVPAFVNVSFDGPEELEFSQSWCEQKIDVNDCKVLELYWYPKTEYCERHNLKVTCTKQTWNVPITFKALSPKITKKQSTTTLKRTLPSLKKHPQKTTAKLSTVSSKAQGKKHLLWNDKPYIPRKISHNKENLKCEYFQSSSNVSFNMTSPENIRGFTYAVNKLAEDDSPNLDDSLEKSSDLCNNKKNMDCLPYFGTPVSNFFHPSELTRKDQFVTDTVENPRVIRNLSFEMNGEMEMKPNLNISSSTCILGRLSSDSLCFVDSNTFVKNNISTSTFTKEDSNFRRTCDRNMLDSSGNFFIKTSNNEQLHNMKSPNMFSNFNINVTPETDLQRSNSKRRDRRSDSFVERLKQLDDFDLSGRSFMKDDKSFERPLKVNNDANHPCSMRNSQRNNRYESSPNYYLKSCRSFEISPTYNKISPKRYIEVFPSNEISPSIAISDAKCLFPIREEPTDESLRRTQIKRKSTETKCDNSPFKRQNISPQTWSKAGGMYRAQTSIDRASKLISSKDKKENGNNTFKTNGVSFVEKKTLIITDPFILAATTAIDPFLTNTIYLDQEWIQKQENRFKNWLNMLLTPPSDLNVSDEGQHHIDAAKLWRECSQKEVAVAPTKEEICIKYHTSSKLETLRRAAKELYQTDIIQCVLNKIYVAIDKNKIEIRSDRNVHLDLSLQSKVLSLLLSYNPLWLRIALETIYNEKLKLSSNSDIYGLSKFLHEKFFKDRLLQRKHKTVHNPKYNVDIKKFMLKKYFSIVYFLDKAKVNTLIPHDPCLFRKNAQVKESRLMLIEFTRDAITAAVGDITKYLKYFGYFVEHRQEYIHEFDYAVDCLGGDLRDGVRLTRVMELILLRNDLTQNLRVPAISRLQKIHNVKLAFESLADAGYQIQHEIEPHHIVEGHREKTLSFLWQIIYKFQAPLVIETTKSIQNWWRSLPVCVKRMQLRKRYQERVDAASKIQRWFRRIKRAEDFALIASLFWEYLKEKKNEKAALKIQNFYRMYKQRKNYHNMRNTIIKLQKQCRLWLNNVVYRKRECAALVIQKNFKAYTARTRYLKMKHAVLILEKHAISRKLMLIEQQNYMHVRSSVITIQRWYRASVQMKKCSREYLKLKSATCLIQQQYRSLLITRKTANEYNALKYSTITIQRWFRSTMKTRLLRQNFLKLKRSVLTVETRFIALKTMRECKTQYKKLKWSALVLQRHFRATLTMRHDRDYYLSLKNAANVVKSKYRANKMMVKDRKNFIRLKEATIFIQRIFRANKLMQIEKIRYQQLKQSAVIVQKYFRGYLLMKKTKIAYRNLKTTAISIQQRYRANKLMHSKKEEYQILRKTVIFVQTRFRANVAMKIQRQNFLKMKECCIIIQRHFRGVCLMRQKRDNFLILKSATCFIQQKFRAQLLMRDCKERYAKLRNISIMIQRRFRANKLMKVQRAEYETLKKTVNFVKTKYIAKKKMLENKVAYQRLKHFTIFIQTFYRTRKMMEIQRSSYLELKHKTITIQRYFRGYLLMKKEKQTYLTMKRSAIIIQGWYRAQSRMIETRDNYNRLKKAVVFVQGKFRANRWMKKERNLFILKRDASKTIQSYFRSYLLMKKERQNYLTLQRSVMTIQQRYIAYKDMCRTQTYYRRLRKYVIVIQTIFRCKKLMENERKLYLQKRNSCVLIQRYFRGFLLMRKERQSYLSLRAAASFVQQKYSAKRAMQICRVNYLRLRQSVIFLQRKFRANLAMRTQRSQYLKQKDAAIKIQKYFRGYQQMKKDRNYFKSSICAVYSIQKYARGFLIRRKYAPMITDEAKEERRIKKLKEAAATKIQARWRGHRQRKLSSNELEGIRKRAESATKTADPQESLASRSRRAMEAFETEEITVPLVISALTDFEYGTRRSQKICNTMGHILPAQLYLLINSVARALPDIQICELSIYILINLCKYEPTSKMIWFPEYLDKLLNVMTNWCDKENMVFPSLCTLFWLFAHKEEYKKVILKIPNVQQRLNKIYSLVLRKKKMVAKSDSKMAISLFLSKKPLYLPCLKPDWGFDYPKRPRMFMHSVQAIECLLKILDLS